MPIVTYYGNVLCSNNDGRVFQGALQDVNPDAFVQYDVSGSRVDIAGLGVFDLVSSGDGSFFFLRKDGRFMCAPQRSDAIEIDRENPSDWEKFLVPEAAADFLAQQAFLVHAIDVYRFGYAGEALGKLKRLHELYPENDDILTEYVRVSNVLNPPKETGTPIKLFVNCDLESMFQKEWMDELLGGAGYDVVTSVEGLENEPLVVIDSLVRGDKVGFYRDLYRRHNRILLVHLSDEVFQDDHRCYQWCRSVWRNLWSPLLWREKKVSFFPLGYKVGFRKSAGPVRSAAERQYTWFFAGDIKKSNRQAMYDNMSRIPGGKSHLTTYFGSQDALSTEEYRAFMENSVFIPCGAGFVHLDSFRIYEALEAGCIPIIENGRDLDVFTPYLGPSPLPMIAHWDEAAPLIEGIMQRGEVEDLRKACHEWWTAHKAEIREKLHADIARLPTSPEY